MRIRDIIEQQGITSKEVADKIGISVSALNQNISGNPSVKVLEKIATALGVPTWQLFASPEEVAGNKEELTASISYRGEFFNTHSKEELKQYVDKL